MDLQTPEKVNDDKLVELARQGDRLAFDELFQLHKPFVYNVCYRMLGLTEDAVDATQATFILAYKSLSGFRGVSKFRTWLYRIAINECSRIMRKSRTRSLFDPELVDEPLPETGGDVVWEAMLELPVKFRAVLVMVYFQGLSCAEAADALGCKEGAARVRLHRAREAFKRVYEELV